MIYVDTIIVMCNSWGVEYIASTKSCIFCRYPQICANFYESYIMKCKNIFFYSGDKSAGITMELFSALINAVVGHVTAKGLPLRWRELQPKGSCREFLTALGLL